MKTITVSDFINTNYKDYWEYSNKNGKNSVTPKEGIPEVVRKIVYAAYMINVKEHEERKTVELKGEVVKFHAHGESSIEDSIKGVATAYKSQPATRLLEGIGNFGAAPGDEGAAARYTSISGTPLLTAIYKDIPFVDFNTDDTGLEQPDYISSPLPMALINGMSSIGTGRSCYLAERDAREIIKWISELKDPDINFDIESPNKYGIAPPKAMSVTGCETWYNNANGYIYYDAVIHHRVDASDISKKGKYDVITALPPKSTPQNVIYKLQQKLPSKVTSKILDLSGKDRPTYIILPTGYLDNPDKDYAKYGLRLARQEQIFTWEDDLHTMAYSNIYHIAKGWFEDRCKVVTRRLQKSINDLEKENYKIDLIKIYVKEEMSKWKSEDIISYFIKLANNDEEIGKADANTVLSQTARAFLPENLEKNNLLKEKNNSKIKEYQKDIENIGDFIIKEAYDIIDKQERFFS